MERAWALSYSIESTSHFDREFRKLDRRAQETIKEWIEKNLKGCTNPRAHGEGFGWKLKGNVAL